MPLPPCLEELSHPSGISAELVPCCLKPLHAVLPILAGALRIDLPHRDHGIDGPDPSLGSAAAVLDADRADLQLEAVVFENDAVIILGLGMNDLRRYDHANDANNGKAARNRVKSILCGRSERN